MKTLIGALLIVLIASRLLAAPEPREETVFLFENRKLTIAVPAGLACAIDKDDYGMIHVRLADPGDKVSGEIRFLPDPEGRLLAARARKELMNELFSEYVAASTEQAMQFEELEPRVGTGTYCVFTDAKLVGKTRLPPGEYLHLTTGLKVWPGVVAIFRVFSQDTSSPEYQAVLKLLRESLEERAVPLK